ncbi:MFS general substrate transporter [Mycena maculata]|uniref:MFS general substrate transporter n=1 Tax=Mycena maculata TaxID=230809 RepID=A0AAD7HUT3_9AGAR|nr:MFS general substrate transporter [Mycena maculata]
MHACGSREGYIIQVAQNLVWLNTQSLAAAFVVEAIVWGFPNAYGVFLDSYLQDLRYASQKSATFLLPLIGILSSGIIYCSAPIMNPIAACFPRHRCKSMWVGAFLCCGTLFGAIITCSQALLYSPSRQYRDAACISYMSEWFVARRGMANSILFTRTAAGGLLLPLMLRILVIAMAVLVFPLLPFVKGRLPPTRVQIQGSAPRGDPGSHSWMRQKSFWILITVNTLQGSAYFVLIVYLPTFAHDLHVNSSKSAVTVAMLNGAFCYRPLCASCFNAWMLAFSILLTTSVMSFILWGVLSHSFAGLLVFSIAYGTVAGGMDDLVMSTTLYGYLLLSRGIGNVVSTPISVKLYSQARNATDTVDSVGFISKLHHFDLGDRRFAKIILYVGTMFACVASVAALGGCLKGPLPVVGPH